MADEEFTKLQELIYTTRVENVMAPDVITADRSMSMNDVRSLMREKRITGLPVMDGDEMVGIVSMSDVMLAVEAGEMDHPVERYMTTNVSRVLKDASVMDVVGKLGRKGFARLPVVDREGALVGIVTTGTIMQSLLREMDLSYQKKEREKLHTYRASHIFEDIVSDDTSLMLRFVVADKDFANAGKASSAIKKSLQRLRVPPSFVRRVAVAVYETEMNLVIHTDVGGEILVDIRRNRLQITAVDHGPGIEDLDKVLQPGYSTAPEWIRDMGFGAGMGLANIKRCSDTMRILSEPGTATRLDITFSFDRPLPGPEEARKKA